MRIRLRYASLLIEETEDHQKAHVILSKGLTMCDRNRLSDLKNSMLHLLVRLLFKTNPRAALTMIDNTIQDLSAYEQTAWIYAFRFLGSNLCAQLGGTAHTAAALRHLAAVHGVAEPRRHAAIIAMASIQEAMIHLRNATSESRGLAQRALATARSHQLQPSVKKVPQLTALVNMVDLSCELVTSKPEQAAPKLKVMQSTMDEVKATDWGKDGTFSVSTGISAAPELEADAGGVLLKDSNGNCALVFDWLKRAELYYIGYLLSGISSLQKDCINESAEQFLQAGLKLVDGKFALQQYPR